MNILTGNQAQSVERPTFKVAKPASAEEKPASQEPQDGFSLGRTLSTAVLGFMNRRIPNTQPINSPEKIQDLKEKIKPGDVLMSCDLSYPGWSRMEYYAIGSEYTHAAFMGSDGIVYEAVGEGVIQTPIDDFLEGRKKIGVARHGLSEEDARAATDYAKSHLGKPYDGLFNFDTDNEFYCSELVAKSIAAGENKIATPQGKIFGKNAIAPDIFLKMPGAEVIHDDKSTYWGNKAAYWPVAASTVAAGVAGGLLGGGVTGAAIGAGVGLVGSILVGNKIQTGHFSPSLHELKSGKH